MFREFQQIGPYKLIHRLGRGGFGEVWLGERQGKFATTKVAVKLPLDEQVDHSAIEHEARLWAKASGHPNVLPIIEADEYDGQIVIVSEYAPDGSLEEYLKQHGKMPIEKAVETTIQILDGLEFLHSRQIIHRDLKPANILFQGNTPRLADFGISRAITDSSLSMTVAGTSEYMAIEAFSGKRNVQTDIFALGVIFYLMLTGRQPFFARKEIMKAVIVDNETLLRQYKDEAPQPLSSDIPAELQKIVFKSLEKSPEYRYQTASQMREDLRQFLHGKPQPAAPEIPPTERVPNIAEPTADNPDSVVTNVKVPFETNAPPNYSSNELSFLNYSDGSEKKFNSAKYLGIFFVSAFVLSFIITGVGMKQSSPEHSWVESMWFIASTIIYNISLIAGIWAFYKSDAIGTSLTAKLIALISSVLAGISPFLYIALGNLESIDKTNQSSSSTNIFPLLVSAFLGFIIVNFVMPIVLCIMALRVGAIKFWKRFLPLSLPVFFILIILIFIIIVVFATPPNNAFSNSNLSTNSSVPANVAIPPVYTPTPNYDIPEIKAMVELKFFESGKETLPQEQRKYGTVFDESNTRYVNYEMKLDYASPNFKKNYKIEQVWYMGNSIIYRSSFDDFIEGNSGGESIYTSGIGNLKVGNYKLEIKYNGVVVKTKNFKVQ